MSDEESLQFAQFILDRFVGAAPEERLLAYALADFKVTLARDRVASAHNNVGTTVQPQLSNVVYFRRKVNN